MQSLTKKEETYWNKGKEVSIDKIWKLKKHDTQSEAISRLGGQFWLWSLAHKENTSELVISSLS